MKKITNLTTRPVVLEDGTILAASRTEGSVKKVKSLSDGDARRLAGSIHVADMDAITDKDAGRTARADASAPKKEENSK
jgi:hypothetical protein